jgi:hypothetical protein
MHSYYLFIIIFICLLNVGSFNHSTECYHLDFTQHVFVIALHYTDKRVVVMDIKDFITFLKNRVTAAYEPRCLQINCKFLTG